MQAIARGVETPKSYSLSELKRQRYYFSFFDLREREVGEQGEEGQKERERETEREREREKLRQAPRLAHSLTRSLIP